MNSYNDIMNKKKLEVGMKVMGFMYNQYGENSFFAGTIREIHPRDVNHPEIDSVVMLDAAFPTSPRAFHPEIDIYTEFDQAICDKAVEHKKKSEELRSRIGFEELCITRLLMKQPINKTYEEYYGI
jgi:hypothetical protein